MGIYRGQGGTGDTTTGEDVFGPNSSITDLSGLTGEIKTPTLIEFAYGDLTPTERQLTWNSSADKLEIGLASGEANVLTSADIGVEVQAYSANLDEFAAVNPTATGLALLDDATIADQRTTLGASTVGANLFTLTNPSAISFPRINADNTVDALSDSNFRTALGLGTLATQSGTFSGTSSGTNTGDQNLFSTIAVSGQSNVVADTTSDTLTLVAGTNISITTDAATDAITITAASTGIADADYGDITVTGTGSVWTIDNDVVTYAKIQNVSATDKLLGRSTAGAGDIEEITCTAAGRAILDDVDASAQRTTLGLGTIATQAASSVSITGGTITGITALAIADGGTGASAAASAFSNLKQAASETATGVVELATSAEAVEGTSSAVVLTPLRFRNALNATGTAPTYACRAWVNFNGSGTVAIRASGNVSSITDNGTGDYTVNFTTAMPDANYAVTGAAGSTTEGGYVRIKDGTTPTVGAVNINALKNSGTATSDQTNIYVSIFR
jgi:hypothetical protein